MLYDVGTVFAILLVGMIMEYKMGLLFRIVLTLQVHKMLKESGEFAFNVKERFEFQGQLEESEESDALDLSEENRTTIDNWDKGGVHK